MKLEGLVRDIPGFSRFLEAASFSQAMSLNISNVAQDCSVERRTVTNYFDILDDLLIAYRLPIFSKRAKREMSKHLKFFYFDVGVFQVLRPKGPLDSNSEIGGVAVETLVLQQLMAYNALKEWDYKISYWRTRTHLEVDFVLYGAKGLHAIEVKSSSRIRDDDFEGLLEFKKDYPVSQCLLTYGGSRHYSHKGIEVVPLGDFLKTLAKRY